ncbi:ATP-binding protein [Kitasatospora sp. CB01950]|uniref:ATP-binding protein n=1 Tax=Kitasatospora sp. CB01950 TaxID=1703930 RepID=UPI00093A0A80|nr:ATP-binding protein [Kitasatospora sp. CB01950]
MTEQTRNVVGDHARVDTVVQAGHVGTVNIHQAAAAVHTPAFELPPQRAHFVDRTEEQRRIVELRPPAGASEGTPQVVAISGLGGIGKTALCLRVGHALAERYPDGAHYLDLDDYRRDGGIDPADVLADLLPALGVDRDWLGRGYRALLRQYWARTRGGRRLLVVDNAHTGAEVQALLPASAGSLVLVASRGPLYDLGDAGQLELALTPLSTDHTGELLRLLLGEQRWAAADPATVHAIAAACAGLPKAAEVAGELARRLPHRTLAALAERLTDELHRRGSAPVEAVWDAAYRELDPAAAKLYRTLAEIPGPCGTEYLAAALLGLGLPDAEDALAELVTAGLLDYRAGGYRQHALVRGHALRRAEQADPDGAERAAARRRVLHWLRRQTARADLLTAGARLTVEPAVPPLSGVPDADLGTAKSGALHWMEANRLSLYGAVALAHATRQDEDAVALAESLWTHYLDHPRHDAVEAFRAAVDSADRADRLPARIRTRCLLARPLWEAARFDEAAALLQQARALADLLGDQDTDRRLAASAVDFRGQLALARGEWTAEHHGADAAREHFDAALADFAEARAVHLAIGNAYGAALQTYQCAKAEAAADDQAAAAELFDRAHRLFAAMPGRGRIAARARSGLGRALLRAGRCTDAEPHLTAALADAEERGSTFDEARIRTDLATLADRTDRPREAAAHRARAAELRATHGGDTGGGADGLDGTADDER